ncbi:hypothetical protein, variant [Aphanomyces astaci]|uniref:5'-3' exonuclease domain-containing protein n=1 Tax=Aphanomyces astaci TaxID=112090 RepID=W4G1G6_APHAT|nr:hypothetical protein, variant [Aphanomyces astaci]ETV72894.1 hypothetical protein, variant [Aphanomyces astaci]|eukprot:XP_009837680.1 hypothetical protein, variant [Aphanomyces astaci]
MLLRGRLLRAAIPLQVACFSTSTSPKWWEWSRLASWFTSTQPSEPVPQDVEPKTCVFIDGNNMLYAKFSPTCTLASNGVAIGATLGFLHELHKVVDKMKPHRVCVFFDTPVITQRKKEDPTYKAKRERMGDALRRQFPLTGSVLKSLAVPVVQVPGVEADDMIASYTKASLESGFNVIVVSNDSDFFQLVQSNASPTVSLYKFRTRWLMGQDEVLQLIGGTSPRLHPDLRALRGDQWGKTPGLPGGISKELAVELLETAGGLLPLLESLDNVRRPCHVLRMNGSCRSKTKHCAIGCMPQPTC